MATSLSELVAVTGAEAVINVQSLAMVEAAVRSGAEKRRVQLAEVLGAS